MELNQYIDHTYLKPFATAGDIVRRCDEAKQYRFASVCVNPCNVPLVAKELAGSGVKVCSVVGFPFGTHTTAIKLAEAAEAIENGADEIDMVINVGRLLEGDQEYVQAEVAALCELCHNRGKLLKVIIETCYLNEEQIAAMCRIVEDTGADFIKTSTGFAGGGATREDVALFARHVAPSVRIKAAGGISGLQDAEDFLNLGASRLGASRIVKAAKAAE